MGNINKVQGGQLNVTKGIGGEWQRIGMQGPWTILKHTVKGFEAEEQTIVRDVSLSEQEDWNRYEQRHVHDGSFVKVYQVEKLPANAHSNGQVRLRVITYRIQARLSELRELTLEQGLFILKYSLIAYRQLAQYEHPVIVTDKMIGVNQIGKIKVWINENFARNAPEIKDRQPISEPSMVNFIINAVVKHVKMGAFQNFMGLLQQNNKTFTDVLRLIDGHVLKMNLVVPDRLNLRRVPSSNPPMSSHSTTQKVVTKLPQGQVIFPQQNISSQPILPLTSLTSLIEPTNNVRTVTPKNVVVQRQPVLSQVQVQTTNLNSISRAVVTPKPKTRTVQQNIVSPSTNNRPVASHYQRLTALDIQPVVSSTSIPQLAALIEPTRAVSPLARHTYVIRKNPPSYEYPRRKHIDLNNAKVTAYAESEIIGVRTVDNGSGQITYVYADPMVKGDPTRPEKRDTVALKDQRSKSYYIKSIVNKPRTSYGRGSRMTLFYEKRRTLRGAPILHEGYDEFITRMKRGERPRSTIVKSSYGGRGTQMLEKRPAVFADKKIVLSETVLEKSPKKKYVSADPVCLSPSRNEVNGKSPRLIKFPIKRQVMVKGYERMSFEQDLEPIIKQKQEKREIETTKNSFEFRLNKLSNPEVVEVREYSQSPPSKPNIMFNFASGPSISTPALHSLVKETKPVSPLVVNQNALSGLISDNKKVVTQVVEPTLTVTHSGLSKLVSHENAYTAQVAHVVPAEVVVQTGLTVSHEGLSKLVSNENSYTNSINQTPISQIYQPPVAQASQISHIPQFTQISQVPQVTQVSQTAQNTKSRSKILEANKNSQTRMMEQATYMSSEYVLKIVEESKKYRANATYFLKQTETETAIRQPAPSSGRTNNFMSSLETKNNTSTNYDDINNLRPETLFEPKPPSTKQPYHYPMAPAQPMSYNNFNSNGIALGNGYMQTSNRVSVPFMYGSFGYRATNVENFEGLERYESLKRDIFGQLNMNSKTESGYAYFKQEETSYI